MTKTELEKQIKELEEKQAELEKQILQLKQVKIEEPKKRWKPEIGEEYYFVNDSNFVSDSHWDNDEIDKWRYLIGNVFKMEEEAGEHKKKIKIQAQFKNFVEERSEELDWENYGQEKYYLYYDYEDEQITINTNEIFKSQGTIYSSSEEILKDAIAEIGEENIKKYVLEVKE